MRLTTLNPASLLAVLLFAVTAFLLSGAPVSAKTALGGSDFSLGADLEKSVSKSLLTLEKSLSCRSAALGICDGPEGSTNIHTAGNNSPLGNARFTNQAEADEAFKQYEIAKNTDSEVVLGRLQDTEAGSQLGMTRLNSDNWSPNVNDAFVQGGIDAGKPFYLGSSPDILNYRSAWNALEGNRGSHPQTVFFRESLIKFSRNAIILTYKNR